MISTNAITNISLNTYAQVKSAPKNTVVANKLARWKRTCKWSSPKAFIEPRRVMLYPTRVGFWVAKNAGSICLRSTLGDRSSCNTPHLPRTSVIPTYHTYHPLPPANISSFLPSPTFGLLARNCRYLTSNIPIFESTFIHSIHIYKWIKKDSFDLTAKSTGCCVFVVI